MKKTFLSLSFLALIVAVVMGVSVQAAPAPVNSGTCSAPPTLGVCADPTTPDYYNGACRPHITTCPTGQIFSCSSGCYTPPACSSGQVNVNPSGTASCKTLVNVVADSLFKIWDGTALKRLVYVDDAPCTTGQVIEWNGSGWVCAADDVGTSSSSQWGTNGSSIYYSTAAGGGVAIGDTITGVGAGYKLDVVGNARISGNFLVDGASTTVTLPPGAINSTEIANGTIMSEDISSSAGITSAQIADGTITTTDISSSAGITSAQIANGTITHDDIGTGEVRSSEIASDSVGSSELQDDSVTEDELDYYFAAEDWVNLTNTAPGGVAISSCDAGDIVLSGECWGTNSTTPPSTTPNDSINITGMYRTQSTFFGTTIRSWRCRGFSTSVSARVLHAKALCLNN